MRFGKAKFAALAAGAALALSVTTPATAAETRPTAAPAAAGTEEFVNDDCITQINAIAEKENLSAEETDAYIQDLCTAQITSEVTEAEPVTVEEAKTAAASMGMNATDTAAFVAGAEVQAINAHNWEHTYWGGSIVEKHAGRTFFNGTHAWVSSPGDPGYHVCHAEGSWAIGFTVVPGDCVSPGAAEVADAVYRFDWTALVKNNPVRFTVGLHHATDRLGNISTWQNGG